MPCSRITERERSANEASAAAYAGAVGDSMAASDYQILDERFGRCINDSATVEKLFTGCRWAEGPAYHPAYRSVIWSDIPNDRMMRWDETSGATGVFRHPAGYTNGN